MSKYNSEQISNEGILYRHIFPNLLTNNGRILPRSFSNTNKLRKEIFINLSKHPHISEEDIWNELISKKYIDVSGKILDKCELFNKSFNLIIDEKYSSIIDKILKLIRKHCGMSTDWAKYCKTYKQALSYHAPENRGIIVELNVGEIRKIIPQQDVEHTPKYYKISPTNIYDRQSHTDVYGEKDEEVRLALRAICIHKQRVG